MTTALPILWRILLVHALILALLITSLRIIPISSPVAAGEEWFPCIGHNCGCKTAQSCFTHCCCFPKQPPAEVKAAPAKESCCSAEAAPATPTEEACHIAVDDTPRWPLRLEIRSAACAGSDPILLAKAIVALPPTCAHALPPHLAAARLILPNPRVPLSVPASPPEFPPRV